MLFEVEGKASVEQPKLAFIERSLRELKSYSKHTFASLQHSDGSYMQVAGGQVTCILERRDVGSSRMLRGYLAKARAPFVGTQMLSFGGGTVLAEPDEFLFMEDDVIPAFQAFFDRQPLPADVKWRMLDLKLTST